MPILLMIAALALNPAPITLDEIISRTTAAVGGAEPLRQLRNIRLIAEWTENGTAFRGDYRATRDGRMRIDVYVDGNRVFSEGIDRTGAWEQRGPTAAPTAVGEAARNALAHGIAYRFDGIWFAREQGTSVTHEGVEVVNGVAYQVMKLRFADGFETYFYVNPRSWLIERQRDRLSSEQRPHGDPGRVGLRGVRPDVRGPVRQGVARREPRHRRDPQPKPGRRGPLQPRRGAARDRPPCGAGGGLSEGTDRPSEMSSGA